MFRFVGFFQSEAHFETNLQAEMSCNRCQNFGVTAVQPSLLHSTHYQSGCNCCCTMRHCARFSLPFYQTDRQTYIHRQTNRQQLTYCEYYDKLQNGQKYFVDSVIICRRYKWKEEEDSKGKREERREVRTLQMKYMWQRDMSGKCKWRRRRRVSTVHVSGATVRGGGCPPNFVSRGASPPHPQK